MKHLVLIIGFVFIVLNNNAQTELWGTTLTGGQDSVGNIFKTDCFGNLYTQEFDFSENLDGQYPSGSLMQASDGMIYGVAQFGGLNGNGVLFQYNSVNHTYTKKIDFNRLSDGGLPHGSLIQASDGMIYGLTPFGGANDLGTLFQYNPINNTLINKLNFDGSSNGSNPLGSLMQASDGKLYGMTNGGGTNGLGVLFQYDPISNIYTKKNDFAGVSNGSRPEGSLIQALNGKLYGMTLQGGGPVIQVGVIFEYDPLTSILTKLHDFDGSATGSLPSGSFVEASNGKLYAVTSIGGINNKGVLFQYDPISNIYVKKMDFDGLTTGSNSKCNLIQAVDGNLYGVTYDGGIYDYGTLFQYNPTTDMFVKKVDFDHINGANPWSNVVEINLNITHLKTNSESKFSLYPNPNNGSFTADLISKSQITITNLLGEIVFSQLMEKGKQNLSIQSQIDGIYFVNVIDVNGVRFTKKIVKQ